MRLLNEEEKKNIIGGAVSITSIINSLSKAANIIIELGRSLGSTIRRVVGGKYCSI